MLVLDDVFVCEFDVGFKIAFDFEINLISTFALHSDFRFGFLAVFAFESNFKIKRLRNKLELRHAHTPSLRTQIMLQNNKTNICINLRDRNERNNKIETNAITRFRWANLEEKPIFSSCITLYKSLDLAGDVRIFENRKKSLACFEFVWK